MSTNLASAFKAGLGGFDEDDDEFEGGLTELEKFSPTRVDGVADPASGFPILLLKSLGTTPVPRPVVSRPLPDLGEAWRAERARAKSLRKAAKQADRLRKARHEALVKACMPMVDEMVGELRERVADAGRRIAEIERARATGVRPGEGGSISWVVKGATGSTVAVAKSRAKAARAATEYDRVAGRMQDVGAQEAAKAAGNPQCPSCGRFAKTSSANFCTKCGTAMSKMDGGDGPILATDGDDTPKQKCRNCKTKFHSEREACPHCGAIADVEKSAGPGLGAMTADEQFHMSVVIRKATQDADPERRLAGIAELTEALGPDAAAKALQGALTPAEFTRAYLLNGRAPLSARPGQSPRIPEVRPISSDDFTRAGQLARQQRQQPLSPLETLQRAGQMGIYRPGAGIQGSDPHRGAPSGTTVWPGLAAAQSMFANAPAPGDARG